MSFSLVATIKPKRPDLLLDKPASGEPIPEQMPQRFFEKNTPIIEGIGEPITATFFTLSDVDPQNWFLFTPPSPLTAPPC